MCLRRHRVDARRFLRPAFLHVDRPLHTMCFDRRGYRAFNHRTNALIIASRRSANFYNGNHIARMTPRDIIINSRSGVVCNIAHHASAISTSSSSSLIGAVKLAARWKMTGQEFAARKRFRTIPIAIRDSRGRFRISAFFCFRFRFFSRRFADTTPTCVFVFLPSRHFYPDARITVFKTSAFESEAPRLINDSFWIMRRRIT